MTFAPRTRRCGTVSSTTAQNFGGRSGRKSPTAPSGRGPVPPVRPLSASSHTRGTGRAYSRVWSSPGTSSGSHHLMTMAAFSASTLSGCREGTASGWGRVGVVVMACVVAAGRPDRGRAVRVRAAGGRGLSAGRTARRAGRRCWRAALSVAAGRLLGGRRRRGVQRRRGQQRPGRRAAAIRAVRRQLRRARPAS